MPVVDDGASRDSRSPRKRKPGARSSLATNSARLSRVELQVVLRICREVDTPRALTVAMLVRACEWRQLASLKFDFSRYLDNEVDRIRADYLVSSLLKKNPRIAAATPEERYASTKEKFFAAEEECRKANERILQYTENPQSCGLDDKTSLALFWAKEYCRQILGPLTRNDLRFAEESMRFGPGATTSCRRVVTGGRKYSPRVLDTTPDLLHFGTFCLPHGWRRVVHGFNIRRSSVWTTVPKTALIDRGICIEPDLNIFVQLGTGALLRSRLRRFGVDLDTQEHNQQLARRGSVDDSLCTMDLSSASDTVSKELICWLLPPRWLQLLAFSRTPETELDDGTVVQLEKWSSMGNGYTFELESLVFLCILLGCARAEGVSYCREDFAVYGDDLIFPTELQERVRSALDFLGFSVNTEKTFGNGPFRESCGHDYYLGRNIRPVFLRSQVYPGAVGACHALYTAANNLRRWATLQPWGVDSRVSSAWRLLVQSVPSALRYMVPYGQGKTEFYGIHVDGGFEVDFDQAQPSSIHIEHGWTGFRFSYLRPLTRSSTEYIEGALTHSLRHGSEFTFGAQDLRGSYSGSKPSRGYVLMWPNSGPWV